MKTSESITKIAPALLAAQKLITFAAKDATNPHFKSKYADLPSVIEAVKPALNGSGIMFLQTADESADNRIVLTTRLLHESGEWIEGTASCPLPKADPQGFGSAMTYLRRYGISAIIGVYSDLDDDATEATPMRAAPPAKTAWITKEQSDKLIALGAIQALSDRITAALAFYKVEAISQLTSDQATQLINRLSK